LNKIISTKTTSAIFLAIVLIAGTIALSPTFFMVGTAQATSDHEKDYDKYDKKSYEQDSHDDRKSYEQDNYKSTEYQSYGKDNSYKSKDSSSVSVKKIKCNNINVNLNGFNGIQVNAVPPSTLNALATGEAQTADEGEKGASSFGSGERNNNVYQHNDKDFRFVCINNNNFEVVEDGTTPTEPPTCEECFTILTEEQIDIVLDFFGVSSIAEFCDVLLMSDNPVGEPLFRGLLQIIEVTPENIDSVVACLERIGVNFVHDT
jgi:uncharacterized protein YxeA